MTGWVIPAVAQFLLFSLLAGMAASVDVGIVKERFKRPFGIILGLACQFVILPFAGFMASKLCGLGEIYGFALLCVTASPGGAYSNWWCSIFNADLALSVAMTTCSTVMSLILTPINLIVYARLAYGTVPNLSWPRLLFSIGVAVFSIGVGLTVSTKFPQHRSKCNLVGNVAGLTLIIFSGLVSSRDDPIWDKEPQFYLAVSSPCLLGLLLAFGVGYLSPCISGPEAVAVTVETSYQNTGLALTIALATFEDQHRAAAAGVPLFYGVTQVILLPIFLLLSWKCGLTYAPPRTRIDRVIREDFQPKSRPSEANGQPDGECEVDAVRAEAGRAAREERDVELAKSHDSIPATPQDQAHQSTAAPSQGSHDAAPSIGGEVWLSPHPVQTQDQVKPVSGWAADALEEKVSDVKDVIDVVDLPGLEKVIREESLVNAQPSHHREEEFRFVVIVRKCGIADFNGEYELDGVKNERPRFRKRSGDETCNYADGSWYLSRSYVGAWYSVACVRELPPRKGWQIALFGEEPAPELVYVDAHLEEANGDIIDIDAPDDWYLTPLTKVSALTQHKEPEAPTKLRTRMLEKTPRGSPLIVETELPDGRRFQTEEPVEMKVQLTHAACV